MSATSRQRHVDQEPAHRATSDAVEASPVSRPSPAGGQRGPAPAGGGGPGPAQQAFSEAVNVGTGPGAFVRARTRDDLIGLLAEAERRLIAAGNDREAALHMITSIFYGGEWSHDHAVTMQEHNPLTRGTYAQNRDANFAQFTGRAFDQDPRPALGTELFRALQASQDVAGTDVGHLLIGLDARMRQPSREGPQTARAHGIASWFASDVPTSATGADIVTWVGDLGGAAARLAGARQAGEPTSVAQWFNPRGTDYGAPSNLAGDLGGMTAGDNPGPDGPGGAPVNETRGIAQVAREAMTTPPSQRAYMFLQSLGGRFVQRTLSNRDAVVATMADRIGSFARFYIQGYNRAGEPLIPQAALDVSNHFLDQLVRDLATGPISVARRVYHPPDVVRDD